MSAHTVKFYDVTCREGPQTPYVTLSVDDKLKIIGLIREAGGDEAEIGWVGANPTDDNLAARLSQDSEEKSVYTFCRTVLAGKAVDDDKLLQIALGFQDRACYFGKGWDYQVENILGTTLDENLRMISETVQEAVNRGQRVVFDIEHFFDGYKENPNYALACVRAAHEAGASRIALCDTRGVTPPDEVYSIVKATVAAFPDAEFDMHAHNDLGCAVANSYLAVLAGCKNVHTVLGYGIGERAGNACLFPLAVMLAQKGYDTGISDDQRAQFGRIYNDVNKLLGCTPCPHDPVVGERVFWHTSGPHQAAVLRDPRSYEGFSPDSVGNKRYLPPSNQMGKHLAESILRETELLTENEEEKLQQAAVALAAFAKEEERKGYSFAEAPENLWLHAKQLIRPEDHPFTCKSFKATSAHNEKGHISKAEVEVELKGKSVRETAVSTEGPVDALNLALHAALEPVFPELRNRTLKTFTVKNIDFHEGTKSSTRVIVEMTQENGTTRTWKTMGVSTNVLSASVEALSKAYTYYLWFVCKHKLKDSLEDTFAAMPSKSVQHEKGSAQPKRISSGQRLKEPANG